MTRQETLMVMTALKAAYPQYYAKQSKTELDGVVRLWTEMFAEEPYRLVSAAVAAIIKTRENPFPPSIGEINAKIRQLTQPDELTEQEAWALVTKAVRNGYYHSREEFNRLPATVQRAVGSPAQLRSWSQIDESVLDSVVASNFQRSYKTRAAREREYNALPTETKAFMAELAQGMVMQQLPDKGAEQ